MEFFQSVLGVPNQGQGRGMGVYQPAPREFNRVFQALPMSFHSQKESTRDVDSGNKILMPTSALEALSRMNIQYPMMFKITNMTSGRSSHCSVLEFTASEGHVHLPLSMMHNLNLDLAGNSYIRLRNVSLPKGSFARFQPFKYEFVTDIPNHKIVLEKTLRSYACLTKGDIIEIKFLNKCHDLEVVELKPADVVSIIETDISVEFKEPKDQAQHEAAKQRAEQTAPQPDEDSSDDDDDFGKVKPRKLQASPGPSTKATGYRLKDGKQYASSNAKNSDAPVKFRMEEEVVGSYRYIYKVNVTTGEREVVRRLPNRGGTLTQTDGHTLR